jgi:hypothetical protein
VDFCRELIQLPVEQLIEKPELAAAIGGGV